MLEPCRCERHHEFHVRCTHLYFPGVCQLKMKEMSGPLQCEQYTDTGPFVPNYPRTI